MLSNSIAFGRIACVLLLAFVPHGFSQKSSTISTASPAPASSAILTTPSSSPPLTPASSASSVSSVTRPSSIRSSTPTTTANSSAPPDVLLNVPSLSVGRIELDVDNLQADINLNANVASLVSINAGVQLSITKVNLTITDVDAELELIVRLGHLVDIVNRIFQSLDLNPLLISAVNNVTPVVNTVVGAVDGLLGSITQGGTTLNFVIDNLGNIVQEVGGVSTIVGNYAQNMTQTGAVEQLGNGLVQKTCNYSPLNALVNIIFNAAGQVVQATVAKQTATNTASTVVPTSTAGARKI